MINTFFPVLAPRISNRFATTGWHERIARQLAALLAIYSSRSELHGQKRYVPPLGGWQVGWFFGTRCYPLFFRGMNHDESSPCEMVWGYSPVPAVNIPNMKTRVGWTTDVWWRLATVWHVPEYDLRVSANLAIQNWWIYPGMLLGLPMARLDPFTNLTLKGIGTDFLRTIFSVFNNGS